MRNKAKNGGTVSYAKLGYINTPKIIDGYKANSIQVDQARAPLIKEAFELYATGEYSVQRLLPEMELRGLTTHATAKRVSKPLSGSQLHYILKDKYYAGYVIFDGEAIRGRHEPIISNALLEQVQKIIGSRSGNRQRDRVHAHYLRRALSCARCHAKGKESPLIYTLAKGRDDTYAYFFCSDRKRQECDLPYLPVHHVEDAVEAAFPSSALPGEFASDLSDKLNEALRNELATQRALQKDLTTQLREAEAREERLLDLAADGLLDTTKVRAKLTTITVQKESLKEKLNNLDLQLDLGVSIMLAVLQLLSDAPQYYREASDSMRRTVNTTMVETFYVDEEDPAVPVS